MSAKPQTDWEAIEREYRAGQLSVREIARQYGVSHVAIGKRAKAAAWTQNLLDRVREAVTTKLVTSEVTNGNASAAEVIEASSDRTVGVLLLQRKDIAAGRALAATLTAELLETTRDRAEIEELIEDETKGDQSPRRRTQMLAAVSLPSRAATLKALSDAAKNFVALERQAFNIDGAPVGTDQGVVSVDRPPRETREQWEMRRKAETGV